MNTRNVLHIVTTAFLLVVIVAFATVLADALFAYRTFAAVFTGAVYAITAATFAAFIAIVVSIIRG